jgi:ornithine decarboxylase
VQVYYAVKANSAPEIVRTFYEAGSSFDVASVAEFLTVHENVKDLPEEARQAFIWDRIIYANPIKANETLEQLDRTAAGDYARGHQIRHAPHQGPWRCAAQHRFNGRAVQQVRSVAG